MIHRDPKPTNILVDSSGRPKILDFGVARLTDSDVRTTTLQTDVGQLIGTLPYMSPEQVSGDPNELDTRSDVYSLGVVLFELLTGRLPCDLRNRMIPEAARVIREQGPTRLSSVNKAFRGDVETIVARALEKEKPRRYQSAAELAGDIRRYLRDEPIVARAPSALYQLGKFARRNRVLVACVIFSFVALATATGAAVRQAVVATRERDAAQRRLAYARQAANYVLWGVGSGMGRVLGTRPLQRHLAEESYVFHRRLAEESPDDPAEQVGLWRALNALCLHSLDLDNVPRARVLIEMLDDEVERFAAAHAEHPEVERGRAQVQHLLSSLARHEGARGSAAEHARQTLQIRRQRLARYGANVLGSAGFSAVADSGPHVGEAPADVQDVASLAAACLTLAEVTSDLDEAEHCCREAQQIYEHLERNDPTREPIYRSDLSEYAPLAGPLLLRSASGPFHRRALAAVHAALGDIALRRGDAHAAEQRQRLALELRQQVARDAPDEPANIAVLATSHAALADLLLEIGEPAGALEHGRLALEGHRRLSQADPDDVGWRRWLLKDYERLLATPAETPAPEIADWQAQAAALREQPPGR